MTSPSPPGDSKIIHSGNPRSLPSDSGNSSDPPAVTGLAVDLFANPAPPTIAQPIPPKRTTTAHATLNRVAYNTTDTAKAKPNIASRLKDMTTSGLESALRALHISAGVIPPLKPAIGELVEYLEIIKGATTTVKEYEELTSELEIIAHSLKEYLSELKLEDPNGNTSCSRIALRIETEVARIKDHQSHSKIRRAIDSAEGNEAVIQQYRRIEALFRQLQYDIGLQTLRNVNKQYVATLLRDLCPTDDARYNSSYSTTIKRRACTKKTREQVQADLQNWAQDPKGAKVYWMNGMAGTGKTTIAYSLCEWLKDKQQLGASFFCSRASSSCRNVNSIIPTITYQLAHYSLGFRDSLAKVLEGDPDSGKLDVARQFEKLIRDPMLTAKDITLTDAVIVIDALDECENDYDVQLILEVLFCVGANLPLKFFVTSRPEPVIREKMLSPAGYPPAIFHLHDIEQSIVEEDIKKYLAGALSPMLPRPSTEQIEQLAKLAGKLFIYAATVVRYILPGNVAANSGNRLKAILAQDTMETNQRGLSKKYKQLDELYSTVLITAFDDEELEENEISCMRLVLWTVVCAKEPMTIPMLTCLLSLAEEQGSAALQPLLSVVHISETTRLVSTFHASFSDYMLDQSRSRNFYCHPARHSELLAHACFNIMQKQLRFNICELESSFVVDKDVADLEQRFESNVTPTLSYACLYWGEHLSLGAHSEVLYGKLVDFLSHQLLFWLEVINLRRRTVTGISLLARAEKWLLASTVPRVTRQLIADARDFVARFAAGACRRSTPHIYISALPFCTKLSSVYTNYWGRMQGLVDLQGTIASQGRRAAQATWMTNWGIASLAVSLDGTRIVSGGFGGVITTRDTRTGTLLAAFPRKHAGYVYSVAFSPDGTRIVSGAADHTVRVWDAHSGHCKMEPLQGHKSSVNSVVFSPDGASIISGSGDCTIRVWDAQRGTINIRPLRGHTDSVNAVVTSPNGAHIASGSTDCTIRLWDARTGDPIAMPLRGHKAGIEAVAFSPDGSRIASGSADRFIWVWDASTGDAITQPFQGHASLINSVAFSPDCTCIVSGSNDGTVRVWDARTGKAKLGPLQGHTFPVSSVVFSPDGARIISGSYDRTIRIWDAQVTDIAIAPIRGHKQSVNSVSFSPDGTRIASGSDDCTVQIWDARTGDTITGPLREHVAPIYSVAFSSDGTRVVSGSDDHTILVRDGYTGEVIAGPFQGHTRWVNSVTFSPDGTRVASGSDDRTILVWETCTGKTVAGPFQGHEDEVNSVAFSPDGMHIASGSTDCTIRVWDASTGKVVTGPFRRHSGSIKSVKFSPQGAYIVSGSRDCTVILWDALTGDVLVGPLHGHWDSVTSVAFSPNGAYITSGSADGTIRLWDVHSGAAMHMPFVGYADSVNSVAFSPDGTRIISGSLNSVIRVCNLSHDVDLQPNSDGWFRKNQELQFWVSLDFHPYVPHPCDTLLIGPYGTTFIEYQHLLLGKRWSECYVG